jgi:hypothetical protein
VYLGVALLRVRLRTSTQVLKFLRHWQPLQVSNQLSGFPVHSDWKARLSHGNDEQSGSPPSFWLRLEP